MSSVPRFLRDTNSVVAPSTVAVERFAGFLRSERSGRTSVGDGRGPIISSTIVNVKPVVEQSSADDSNGWNNCSGTCAFTEPPHRKHAPLQSRLPEALPIAGRVVVSKPNAASIKKVLSSAWWLDQGDSRSAAVVSRLRLRLSS